MQPPIGIANFRKLIEYKDPNGNPYLFVDKSTLVKEILDDATEVKLIVRPRRFGKTLNMSMLQHFLADQVESQPTAYLFNNLKISEHKNYIERYQGKYPVIFMTFKDISQADSYESAYQKFCKILSLLYLDHQYLLSSDKLISHQKNIFESILEERATEASAESALLDLSRAVSLHYGVKPWILIDEYDTPIQTAYLGKYYQKMVSLMRAFLGAGLKDNSFLDKAVLTGILSVSKESLFSGLNNIDTYSLLDQRFGDYFGFTEEEVSHLLTVSNLREGLEDVKKWYNGYQIGKSLVYNPWSITNYIQKQGQLSSYWVNTSNNTLIKDLLLQSSTNFKMQFENLLQDKPIEMLINEFIIFNNLSEHESTIWTLLLMSGYLKASLIEYVGQNILCQLSIPNNEVKTLYKTIIAEWLSGENNEMAFNTFLNNLLNGNMLDFEENLRKLMLQTFSTHDVKGKNPEKFFHGFILGLVACIDSQKYLIQSNKESGYGRFDIAILPKDISKIGIIIEVKNLEQEDIKLLRNTAQEALRQINEREYSALLTQNGLKKSLKIGVTFSGKDLAVAYQTEGF